MAASARLDPATRPTPPSELSLDKAAANEPIGTTADATAPDRSPPKSPPPETAAPSNLVRRTVEEICALTTSIHDIREDLRARGVDFHQTKLMVERGLKDPPEDRGNLVAEAVERARTVLGPDGIDADTLDESLDRLVALEKDNRHVRILALEQGINMQPLNYLTQLIGLNPGDGGVQGVNLFIAYADAAGIPFDRVGELRAQFADEPKSVLPDIPRDVAPTRAESLREFGVNVAVGLVLTVIIMTLTL